MNNVTKAMWDLFLSMTRVLQDGFWVIVVVIQYLEVPTSDIHQDSHDDALSHACNQLDPRT